MYLYYPYMRQNIGQQRIMTTTGSGSLSVEPDMVSIQMSIVTENKELQTAQAENTEKSNQVIHALKNLGIAEENIQTSVYSINPMYDYVDGRQILRGYQVEHTLTVDVQSIDHTGMIIDTAVKNGVNQISSIQFSVRNDQEYYRQALNLAVEDAIAKAQSMADTLNVNLDAQPIKVDEGISEQPIVYQTFAMEKANSSTPIQPGQVLIEATVRVRFQYFV